jgi:alpha-tubulin suppressor-like RCC1 family protein
VARTIGMVLSLLLGAHAAGAWEATGIAAGDEHNCAVTAAGGVGCWGSNQSGKLGDGTHTSRSRPVAVVGLSGAATAVAAGSDHTCALTAAGGVECWGSNQFGQLGNGTTASSTAPVAVTGLSSGVAAIAAGYRQTCALTATGGVECWGAGFLGNGTATSSSVPVPVAGLSSGVTAIALEYGHACAAMAAGGVRCWGSNVDGQLGDGTNTSRTVPVPVVGLSSAVTALTAGRYHTCALTAGGGVLCWGIGTFGELGNGTNSWSNVPVPAVGLASGVLALEAGGSHTCALTSDAGVVCWGYNLDGELGMSTAETLAVPTPVPGVAKGVIALAAGTSHTCVLVATGGIQCWGYDGVGQLGDGTAGQTSVPQSTVVGLSSSVTALAASDSFSCALTAERDVECWGYYFHGGGAYQSDRATVLPWLSTDVAAITAGFGDACAVTGSGGVLCSTRSVPALAATVAQVALGRHHTCALTTAGGVLCWGTNGSGQLGDGSTVSTSVPVPVVGLSGGVAAIGAGEDFTCVLTTAGGVSCWGSNVFGELGNGSTMSSNVPVPVVGLASGVASIAVGRDFTCARTTAGGILCWGTNGSGQLGDGSSSARRVPVPVVGLSGDVAAITVGFDYACALTTAGEAECWGDNQVGQLGNGSTQSSLVPVAVAELPAPASAIAAGSDHTCALTTDGAVRCWGNNSVQQLGDLYVSSDRIPAWVSGLAIPPVAAELSPLAAGGNHTCAVAPGGGAQCWGSNDDGELGNATTEASNVPVSVVGLAGGVAALAAGSHHTCALTTVGGVLCWGMGVNGQLGDGTSAERLVPTAVVGLESGVAAITAGSDHTCALTLAGRVLCWGSNANGYLGDGTTEPRSTPVPVVGLEGGALAIAAGDRHTCARMRDGSVRCWGWNIYGQLGDGTTSPSSVPVPVTGLADAAVAIAAGSVHTCAVLASGSVQCWGWNSSGQLGDGTTTASLVPVSAAGLSGEVAGIAAGAYHTCARTTSGAVQCWGYDADGQVGDGSTAPAVVAPLPVVGLSSGVSAIAAGSHHSCAQTTGGGLLCWGDGGAGQLGNGETQPSATPAWVSGLARPALAIESRSLAAGTYHTCAQSMDGGVLCWGYNGSGQLGSDPMERSVVPIPVAGLSSGIAAIAGGDEHTCALTAAGGVVCWGSNYGGELGDGSAGRTSGPVQASGLATGVLAIAAGQALTCALTTSNGVLCWGWNIVGQLGNGSLVDSHVPTPVTGLSNGVAAISAGKWHTCALTTGGGVFCWGDNFAGQLGADPSIPLSTVPLPVAGLSSGVAAIAASTAHTCALTTAGGVLCWGDNAYGGLGDGTTTNSSVPVPVIGLPGGVVAIAAGEGHTCALTLDGRVLCWGINYFGELGDGTTTDRSVPVEVVGLSSAATEIATGNYHTCARLVDGSIECWGYNEIGSLGDGTTTSSSVPVPVMGFGPTGAAPVPSLGLPGLALLAAILLGVGASQQRRGGPAAGS